MTEFEIELLKVLDRIAEGIEHIGTELASIDETLGEERKQ